jgi:hypothetical protein
MLFLGARQQDAIRLGPKNKRDAISRKKTTYKRVDESVKPILAPLAKAIRQIEWTGLTTFLVTERGVPFTEAGFGNKMRDWCDRAGLPECTAHGLKKIVATIVAEMGATNRAMMAADAARLLGQFSWSPTPPEGEQTKCGGLRGRTESKGPHLACNPLVNIGVGRSQGCASPMVSMGTTLLTPQKHPRKPNKPAKGSHLGRT